MCKTIKQIVKFHATPLDAYVLLAHTKKHAAFTGKKAVISSQVGGPFSAYDGYISGINVDLLPGQRLVQAWRCSDFPSGIFSMAAFTFVATADGGTQLTLTHRGVPKALIPAIEQGWRNNYWAKMRDYLLHTHR